MDSGHISWADTLAASTLAASTPLSQHFLFTTGHYEHRPQGQDTSYAYGSLDEDVVVHSVPQPANISQDLDILNSLPMWQSGHNENGTQAPAMDFQSNNNAAEACSLQAFPQGVSAGCVPHFDISLSENGHGVEIALDNQRQRAPPKGKRKRDSNWTADETSVLVDCKEEAMREKGSRFCKGKPTATNWDAISAEIKNNLGTVKTGDQCRLRWDTLVKSYQKIRAHCKKSNKEFSELTKEERDALRLATALSEDRWYEVIDQFCRPKPRKARAQKRDGPGKSCRKQVVNALVKKKLLHIRFRYGDVILSLSRLSAYAKFVKKVVCKNPDLDIYRRLDWDYNMSTLESSSLPQGIATLVLSGCTQLVEADLRNLRKLRCLVIRECYKLEVVSGWEQLRELGWLEISACHSYRNYPTVQCLPSLQRYELFEVESSQPPSRLEPEMSRFVRLCRLEVYCNKQLKESGDLSSLKCLQVLLFCYCSALSTIRGLSGLHSLTELDLSGCKALSDLGHRKESGELDMSSTGVGVVADLGHMKALVELRIGYCSVEEIAGVEELVSLERLWCLGSKLKRLPDLHHLPRLQVIDLHDTPLVEDPSSIYFGEDVVKFNYEERWRWMEDVEVSDVSDSEHDYFGSEEGFNDYSDASNDVCNDWD